MLLMLAKLTAEKIIKIANKIVFFPMDRFTTERIFLRDILGQINIPECPEKLLTFKIEKNTISGLTSNDYLMRLVFYVQSNLVITNCLGPTKFVRDNRGSL